MIEIFNININILELVVIPLVILLGPVLFSGHIKVIAKKPLDLNILAALLFIISILISSFVAVNFNTVLTRAIPKWIEIFGLSVLMFLYSSSMRRFKHLWYLLICTSILSALGIFYLDFWRPYSMGEFSSLSKDLVVLMGLRRISGGDLLLVMSLILPFIKKNYSVKIASVFFGILIILSLSRSALLGLVSILLYWLSRDKGLYYVVKLTLAIFLFFFGLWILFSWIREPISIRRTEMMDFSMRKELAISGISIFLSNPITGIGAENFAEYILQAGSFPVGCGVTENLTPHSIWLQTAAENGILGLLAFAWWFYSFYWILWRYNTFATNSPWLHGLRLSFIAFFVLLTFGYVGGSGRLQLGLFSGMVLASLRTSLKPATSEN